MLIREVSKTDDFTAIANIYAASWRAAYKGIVPQEYLDALRADHWAATLRGDSFYSFVAMDGNRYVGTASVAPSRDEKMPGWGELVSIYLLPEYLGEGYASPLLREALSALAYRKYEDVYLWVLEENRRARRFYEKYGFHANGDTIQANIGGKELTEVRYIRKVTG